MFIMFFFTVKLAANCKCNCTNLPSNSRRCVKFLVRTGFEWKLRPKPSHSERSAVVSSGMYTGWDVGTVTFFPN